MKTRRRRIVLPVLALWWIGIAVSGIAETNAETLYAKVSPSVGLVVALDAERTPLDIGSGFFVEASGLFLIHLETLDGATYADVKLPSGPYYPANRLAAYDATLGLALLVAEAADVPVLPLAKRAPSVGETVFAVSSPEDVGGRAVPAIVEGVVTVDGSPRYKVVGAGSAWLADVPVVNAEGEVVGMSVVSEGKNLVIPTSAFLPLVRQAKASEPVVLSSVPGTVSIGASLRRMETSLPAVIPTIATPKKKAGPGEKVVRLLGLALFVGLGYQAITGMTK